jgi:transposase InsO family protein
MTYKPKVRRDKLTIREVGQELVVYDARYQRAHRLNKAAAPILAEVSGGDRTIMALIDRPYLARPYYARVGWRHGWRLSNTLGDDFCVEALEEALSRYGPPEIFNTDQGSRFTSDDFTGTLKDHGIMMVGKGRCTDSIACPLGFKYSLNRGAPSRGRSRNSRADSPDR